MDYVNQENWRKPDEYTNTSIQALEYLKERLGDWLYDMVVRYYDGRDFTHGYQHIADCFKALESFGVTGDGIDHRLIQMSLALHDAIDPKYVSGEQREAKIDEIHAELTDRVGHLRANKVMGIITRMSWSRFRYQRNWLINRYWNYTGYDRFNVRTYAMVCWLITKIFGSNFMWLTSVIYLACLMIIIQYLNVSVVVAIIMISLVIQEFYRPSTELAICEAADWLTSVDVTKAYWYHTLHKKSSKEHAIIDVSKLTEQRLKLYWPDAADLTGHLEHDLRWRILREFKKKHDLLPSDVAKFLGNLTK